MVSDFYHPMVDVDRCFPSGQMNVTVTGAGGFIGGWLTKRLLSDGHEVRACDIKPFNEWFQKFDEAENLRLDLRDPLACRVACSHRDYVYQLAADMGGMGYIEANKAKCMLSVLINTNMLIAARDMGVQRYFFSSSACVYNQSKQNHFRVRPLKETDAHPADPEDGYGWEKLFSERMCRHFREDLGLQTRIARYHNVYGAHGTYFGGREKAPAAICRKVVEAKLGGKKEVEIWGTGEQTRSFMFIDDCITGTLKIMDSDYAAPLNLGSNELVTINQLVDIVEEIAGVKLKRIYNADAPKGVNGRNSDNSLIQEILGWQPSIRLRDGMARLYDWIECKITKNCLEQAI